MAPLTWTLLDLGEDSPEIDVVQRLALGSVPTLDSASSPDARSLPEISRLSSVLPFSVLGLAGPSDLDVHRDTANNPKPLNQEGQLRSLTE